MSNIIRGHWKQYFQMPIVAKVETLSLPAYRLYGFLCRELNVRSAVEQQYSNYEIASATGLKDHKTISKARHQLKTAGLIDWHTVPPGVCAYILLDEHGDAIPAPEGRKGVRQYASNRPRTTKRIASEPSSPQTRQSQTRQSQTRQSAQPSVQRVPHSTEQRRCRIHGLCEHWLRGDDWLCHKCHPNPFRPLTAREVGFTD